MGRVHAHIGSLIDDAREALLSDPQAELNVEDFDGAPADTRMLAKVTLGLEEALECYDGAMEDCVSAVRVVIRCIKGASSDDAREWVCANYPALAFETDLMDSVQRARFVAKQATGEE